MARQRRKNGNRQQSNAVFSMSLKSERETDHRTTKQRRGVAETKESDSRVEFWNEQLVRVCMLNIVEIDRRQQTVVDTAERDREKERKQAAHC